MPAPLFGSWLRRYSICYVFMLQSQIPKILQLGTSGTVIGTGEAKVKFSFKKAFNQEGFADTPPSIDDNELRLCFFHALPQPCAFLFTTDQMPAGHKGCLHDELSRKNEVWFLLELYDRNA